MVFSEINRRIKQLEAENLKLREALEQIVNRPNFVSGPGNDHANANFMVKTAKAVLSEIEKELK